MHVSQDLNVSNPRNVFFHPLDVLCYPALDVGISWSQAEQTCLHLFYQDPSGALAELSSHKAGIPARFSPEKTPCPPSAEMNRTLGFAM